MVEDCSYGLDSDENGQHVELCFAAEMSKVALSEQRRVMLDADRATTMRMHVAAAAKRAAVVKEDDLLAKADIQGDPKVSKALYTELRTWFDNRCFNVQDISKASNIMTPRRAHKW
eukprot:5808362-Pyramimonas_sp.AAC.1